MKTITVTEQEMLAKAQSEQYEAPVTAFLFDVDIIKRGTTATATGNVYGHVKANPETGLFADGHLIHTSDIARMARENGYWVIQTRNSRYVAVTLSEDARLAFSVLESMASGNFIRASDALH